MAGRIPEDVVDRIREATDIVDLVSSYVALKRSGRSFKGLCPFHDEKTPSFIVNPERQSYKCFGCGEGGNVFTFLMQQDRLTFPEAARLLAERSGIPIPEPRESAPAGESREALFAALRFADEFFRERLASSAGNGARRYLERRGISPATIERFGVGYAPASWDGLLASARRRRLPPAILAKAGLVIPKRDGSHYDRFRDRVVFPIRDLQGRVVGFGGRTLGDGEPKYLNSPETALFQKGHLLYGLTEVRRVSRAPSEIALMEGYTDVVLAHQHGIESAVATLGTSLTPDHARLLRRFTERVVLVFDGDDAGDRASARGIEPLLEADLEVRIVHLPAGIDPADLVVREGGEALARALADAPDFLEDEIQRTRVSLRGGSDRDRGREALRLVSLARRIPGAAERALRLRRISEELGVPEAALRADARGARERGGREGRFRRLAGAPDGPAATEAPGGVVEKAERDLAEAMCGSAEILETVARGKGRELFRHPVHRQLVEVLLERHGSGRPTGAEALLADARDPAQARLLSEFVERERRPEDYARLGEGAFAFFERSRRQSGLAALADERRQAITEGDPARIDEILRRTEELIRAGGSARREEPGPSAGQELR